MQQTSSWQSDVNTKLGHFQESRNIRQAEAPDVFHL
jgi:hypothetical protein